METVLVEASTVVLENNADGEIETVSVTVSTYATLVPKISSLP